MAPHLDLHSLAVSDPHLEAGAEVTGVGAGVELKVRARPQQADPGAGAEDGVGAAEEESEAEASIEARVSPLRVFRSCFSLGRGPASGSSLGWWDLGRQQIQPSLLQGEPSWQGDRQVGNALLPPLPPYWERHLPLS